MDIQDLFLSMVDKTASDLYLTVARPPMYRIDGVVKPIGDHHYRPQELEDLAQSIMNERQRQEFAETMEMNLAMALPNVSRFRVN
ncbi:MAG: type IV pili twitching motility protein PilT, partial [Deltaproteobacteria bacterium]|nr:type IV pili twitching motility protein PilT [Deltaproteobacteria bacterium]